MGISTSRVLGILLLSAAPAQADPARGYDFLVNSSHTRCGLPYSYLERLSAFENTIPKPLRDAYENLFRSPLIGNAVFGDPEIGGRQGLNAKINPGFTATPTPRGNLVVANNCLTCHSQKIGDQLIVGLGNSLDNYTRDPSPALWALGVSTFGKGERTEAKYISGIEKKIGPYSTVKTIGLSPALHETYAIIAHRDPKTFGWSKEALLAPPDDKQGPPIDVPAWWQMRKRKTMYFSGELMGDIHRILMLSAIVCLDSPEAAAELDGPAQDVLDYVRTLEPPKFPGPVDATLARQGNGVFEKTCVRCHGTYGEGGFYPETVVPIETVGTDPAVMNEEVGPKNQRFRDWVRESYFGELTTQVLNPGYVAPPLDGIWATAPYFHNGSVPNIHAVLKSSERPKYWTRSFDAKDYDLSTLGLGWKFTEVLEKKKTDRELLEKRGLLYDTSWPGYSNAGHTFGDSLSEPDRLAVIEYLKTL